MQPDVAVPADLALVQAHILALRDVQRRGYAGPEPLEALIADAERALAGATARP